MQNFHLFGACGNIHTDWRKSFLSTDFASSLHSLRIATSNTSVYNPTSDGQCEKYNDAIWAGVELALREKCSPISKWEVVLAKVLHSVHSLLCTSTNAT